MPLSLRKRIAAVLHCLDKQARGGRGSGGIYVAYGAVVVGFLLALRYYRECRTLRQLNLELKNAFDFHVLKVSSLQVFHEALVSPTPNCSRQLKLFGYRDGQIRPWHCTEDFKVAACTASCGAPPFWLNTLQVLDLNEKLARGSNIPIVHNCGFKDLSFSRRSYGYRPTGFPPAFLTISS